MYNTNFNSQQINQTRQNLALKLNVSERFAEYLLKHSKQSKYEAEEMFKKLKPNLQKLETLFQKYQIDGFIQHKDETNDSYTAFFKALGIEKEKDTIIQLYITQKFCAKKKLQFDRQEFILGMVRFKCNTIAKLKALIPKIRIKIEQKNLYKKLYIYYFKVYSEQRNTIKLEYALFLWEFLLKERFVQIAEFVQYWRAKMKPGEIMVSFDLWCQVWKFFETFGSDYSKFDENDAWPAMIYEYVQWKAR